MLAALKGQWSPDLQQERVAAGQGSGIIPLCTIIVLCLDMGAPAQEACGAVGVDPEESHEHVWRVAGPFLQKGG